MTQVSLVFLEVLVVVAFLAGAGVAFLIFTQALKKKQKKIIEEAESEAEVIKKDKILQAKEKFIHLKAEHEKYINERNNKLAVAEQRFKQKESALNQRIEENKRRERELEEMRSNITNQLHLVEKKLRNSQTKNFTKHLEQEFQWTNINMKSDMWMNPLSKMTAKKYFPNYFMK